MDLRRSSRFGPGAVRSPFFLIPILVGLGVLIVTMLPYWLAARGAGPDLVFGGLLFNPQDGNSYLAKMMIGWRGEWQYTFPFTAEPGHGAYLFLLYIFLGHVARLLGLGLALTFHLARLVGVLALLFSLYRFFQVFLAEPAQQRLAFCLAALGSGFGWLAFLTGAFTTDFWVAEAYPFLSMYGPPHFSLGLALLLALLIPGGEARAGAQSLPQLRPQLRSQVLAGGFARGLPRGLAQVLAAWPAAPAGLALALMAPFGLVIFLVVWGGCLAWGWRNGDRSWTGAGRLLWALFGGGPVLLYTQWAVRADPVVAGWNAQNLTPSPVLWDLLVSFAPVLLLAGLAVWLRRREMAPDLRLLLVWAGAGLVLMYLPWSLQRRFIMGLYVPLAGLAAWGLPAVAARLRMRSSTLALVALLLAVPTNLLVLLAAQHGIRTHDSALYLHHDEARAFEWVRANSQPDDVILAAPETGLFIPAHTGRRVVYGHPFETVNAEAMKEALTAFFTGEDAADRQAYLAAHPGLKYIFYGPREQKLGRLPLELEMVPVFSSGEVTVYAPAESSARP